jgi:hypothetical protein
MPMKALSTALLLFLIAPSPAVAQVPRPDSAQGRTRTSRVLGVYDDVGVVADAEVIDLLSCRRSRDSTSALGGTATSCAVAVTSSTGNVTLSWVVALRDTAVIRIRKIGYADSSFAVAVGPTDTAGVVVVLTRLAQATLLPAVTVVDSMQARMYPLLRGFFERQRSGNGKFIGPSLLRAMEERGIESVDVALSAIGANQRRAATLNDRRCLTAIYLDGQRIPFDTTKRPSQVRGFIAPNLPYTNPLMLKDFDAIEFYKGPGTTPNIFLDPEATCGSLVLWTRSR